VNAEIKRIYSLDIDDLEVYSPDELDCFGFNLRLIAGPKGQPGEESFDIQVCTPQWLLRHYRHEEVIIGRHFLIVFEYSFPRLKAKIEKFSERCTGDSWNEVASKLSRIGYWEFEDYQG
jgi:immunity protein 8 of polymorphic toxin system